jgi:hypothetical protein
MLLWLFRTIFIIIILGVLFFSAQSKAITTKETINFWAVVWSGLGMGLFVFVLDVFTPKKKLSALAGVFFGLLVGLLFSAVLAPLVNMINDSYGIGLEKEAVA